MPYSSEVRAQVFKGGFQLDQQKDTRLSACVSTHMHRKSKWGKMLPLLNLGVHKCSLDYS